MRIFHAFVFYNPQVSSRMPTEHMLRLRLGNILFSSIHEIFMEPRQGYRQAQPLRVSAASCSPSVLTGQGHGQVQPSLHHCWPICTRDPSSSDTEVPALVCVGDHDPLACHGGEGEEGKSSATGILRRPVSPRGHRALTGAVAAGWAAATASRPPVSGSSALFPVSGRRR